MSGPRSGESYAEYVRRYFERGGRATVRELMERTGASKPTVANVLRELRADGLAKPVDKVAVPRQRGGVARALVWGPTGKRARPSRRLPLHLQALAARTPLERAWCQGARA